jgi:putative ABC transport system permease protein
LLVALCGISLTLLVLARERASELALYRALGAVRAQVFRLFLGEALTIGLLGLALGTLAGLGLALILIHVINPAFFGWTIRSAWPWSELVRQDALLLAAALLAGVYPAARASRLSPLELTRDAT